MASKGFDLSPFTRIRKGEPEKKQRQQLTLCSQAAEVFVWHANITVSHDFSCNNSHLLVDPQGLPDKASVEIYDLWQEKENEKTQSARSNGTKGRREETWVAAGVGSVVFHSVLIGASKEGGLHDADLPPLTVDWAKHCRSRPDLSDLNNIREQTESRQQIGVKVQRSSRRYADLDMQMEERPIEVWP